MFGPVPAGGVPLAPQAMLERIALLYVTERVAVPIAFCEATTLETVGAVVLGVKVNDIVVGFGLMKLPNVSFTLLITALYEPLVSGVPRVRFTAVHEVLVGLHAAAVTALKVMPVEVRIA